MNLIKQKISVAVALAFMSAVAMAQTTGTDPGIEAINGLSSKATSYIAAAFAVAVLVAGGFWGIKMMKKAFSKAG